MKDQIIKLYESGLSLRGVSKNLKEKHNSNISHETIRHVLLKNNINPRDKSHLFYSEHLIKDICQKYLLLMTMGELKSKTGLGISPIRRILKYNNIQIRPKGRIQGKFISGIEKHKEQIIDSYLKEKKSLYKIAKSFNTSHMTISRLLKANGITFRRRGLIMGTHHFSNAYHQSEDVVKDYENLYTVTALSKKYKCSIPTIYRIINKHIS